MSRVMIDRRQVSGPVKIMSSKSQIDQRVNDDVITVDTSSQDIRLFAKIGKWYETPSVVAHDGDCFKMYRRYPFWVFLLFVVVLCAFYYTKQYQMGKFIVTLLFSIYYDKYYAYTMKRTTTTLAMS
ncbi:hypothetical protein KG090_02050 [Carnobacteriaceae bacterium zg-ZUI240]|nr:hypothetical protein [Carnobacteriaceae bacterium zg-ZUI240]